MILPTLKYESGDVPLFTELPRRGLLGNSEPRGSPILDNPLAPGNCHYMSNLCVAREKVVGMKNLPTETGWII
jgi:hypothetical protein